MGLSDHRRQGDIFDENDADLDDDRNSEQQAAIPVTANKNSAAKNTLKI